MRPPRPPPPAALAAVYFSPPAVLKRSNKRLGDADHPRPGLLASRKVAAAAAATALACGRLRRPGPRTGDVPRPGAGVGIRLSDTCPTRCCLRLPDLHTVPSGAGGARGRLRGRASPFRIPQTGCWGCLPCVEGGGGVGKRAWLAAPQVENGKRNDRLLRGKHLTPLYGCHTVRGSLDLILEVQFTVNACEVTDVLHLLVGITCPTSLMPLGSWSHDFFCL